VFSFRCVETKLRGKSKVTEVEGTTEAFINADHRGIIVSASDSCKLLFGYDVREGKLSMEKG
jgi:hypothetical protein